MLKVTETAGQKGSITMKVGGASSSLESGDQPHTQHHPLSILQTPSHARRVPASPMQHLSASAIRAREASHGATPQLSVSPPIGALTPTHALRARRPPSMFRVFSLSRTCTEAVVYRWFVVVSIRRKNQLPAGRGRRCRDASPRTTLAGLLDKMVRFFTPIYSLFGAQMNCTHTFVGLRFTDCV